jgi:hypothetical protein
LIETDPV